MYLLFDEIYCNGIHILNSINNFIGNTKDEIIIASGDSENNTPVTESTNQAIDYDEYMDDVMSQLFKHDTFLNINKIFEDNDDMQRLEELKQMLNCGCNINDLMLIQLSYIDNINESETNIAYLNETCKKCKFCITKEIK